MSTGAAANFSDCNLLLVTAVLEVDKEQLLPSAWRHDGLTLTFSLSPVSQLFFTTHCLLYCFVLEGSGSMIIQ